MGLTRMNDVTTSFIKSTINNSDPFKGFFYPLGATGLSIDLIALDIGQCEKGFYYVFSKEKETMEVMKCGEPIMTSSEYFYRSFWKFATIFEARCFIKFKKTNHKSLLKYFEILD